MEKDNLSKRKGISLSAHFYLFLILFFSLIALLFAFPKFFTNDESYVRSAELAESVKKIEEPVLPPLNTVLYDQKIEELANNPIPEPVPALPVEEGQEALPPPEPVVLPWPVDAVYPNAGALLPFNRIIAYYGNLYSRKMGVLGEYDEEEMFAKLDTEVKKWEAADPDTPVVPALHYIAVVAQGSAGKDGMYRFRMPDSEIEKVLAMAEKIDAIVFLDFQVAFSTLHDELPVFEKYFKMPNVHLGIDPEFSMKGTQRPGKVVGVHTAEDINFAAEYLANIVRENNLTPKVLVVHRYTMKMVRDYELIKPLPEVQIVMHMDGWGGKAKKKGTYRQVIYKEPVQFSGFKLFYKNDVFEPDTVLMTPEELLELNPRPSYIQYQ